MLEEKAVIIRIENTETWVEVKPKQACNSCQTKKGCGVSILNGILNEKPRFFRVVNKINAQQGEQVVIGIDELSFLKASFIGYIFPLLSLLLFSIIGRGFAQLMGFSAVDLNIIIFGLGGLYFGIKMAAHYTEKNHQQNQYQAVVLRKDVTKCIMI